MSLFANSAGRSGATVASHLDASPRALDQGSVAGQRSYRAQPLEAGSNLRRERHISARFLLLTSFLVCLGCGTALERSDGAPRPTGCRVITGRDLEHPAAATALDLIRMLRPRFLQPAGPARTDRPAVYVDGVRSDGAVLAHVPKEVIVEIRYLTAAEASFAYGPGHNRGGAVVVRTAIRKVGVRIDSLRQ